MDTIFALATAAGKAGVAVIRVSGPDAHRAASVLSGREFSARDMVFSTFRDQNGAVLDRGLVLCFDAPASFTGEDVIEFQLHGSTAVVSRFLQNLSDIEGLRLADPGEFTRRSLENGKLDLAQVEGLADLIDAETEAQRQQAQRILSGDLGDLVEEWRTDLIRAAALIAATIDFADEDVPVDVTPEVNQLLTRVRGELVKQIEGVDIAERIRLGFEVAIVGAPNVGKSTLLNALAGRQAAITSEFAGTTRDVIEVRMDISGLPVTLLDTAGIRETTDHVEGLGIELAKERAAQADLRVFLYEKEEDLLELCVSPDDIRLRAKSDLLDDPSGVASISGKTGEGVESLLSLVSDRLLCKSSSSGLATRPRHLTAMKKANSALDACSELLLGGEESYDIAAEEIYVAIRALESLVGRVDVEDLLDEIFSSFCLGK